MLGPRRCDLGRPGRAEVLDALDREDVGEVGGKLEREHCIHLALGAVRHGDRLLETASDEELAPHLQPGRPAQVEHADVRRTLFERDRLTPLAVNRQDRARQEARVGREEPGRRRIGAEVAPLVADDERGTVEKRQPHASIVWPLSRSKK